MPEPNRSLTLAAAARLVAEHAFHPAGAGGVGIELEWFPLPRSSPDRLRALLPDCLPGASRVSFEPGGQLELSGPRASDVGGACTAMRTDTAAVRDALAPHGVELDGIGLDPRGARPRVVDTPRYRAMEAYFDLRWPLGRTMMRNTAAVQVNVDAGTNPHDVEVRWQRANDLGPVLAAMFANSPFDATGRPTGWRSARLAVWASIDASRTASAHRHGITAIDAYTSYALDAPVMMIRVDDEHSAHVETQIPFARWIEDGHELGWPTREDLVYHLTTLFPPVRPRGWLELRMIDALPEEWWPVAVAVTAALLDDPAASATAAEAAAPVRTSWTAAARDALHVPALYHAARQCFACAREAFSRMAVDPVTVEAADAFNDRYVARGRCPADDRLDEHVARTFTVA